ncbi:uncharacterized protein LOC129581041 [Paramacrobiotus metropolitanus]|uniref:uncharacterized protein LOC129581041 n=1 Tax=Paramacrobiotus metropolitanus TaxID=2943436 RepID=UPI0024458D52|nr:uncharacterized protein LOC129581041 [Paramacrobiotus metropolitanus]
MGHPLIVVAVAVGLASWFPGSLQCSQQGVSVDTINRILDQAKERNASGTMHLQGHGRGLPTRDFPLAAWPPNTQVIRAPEGGRLLIPCNNTNNTQVSHLTIPPAFSYNGQQVNFSDAPTSRPEVPATNYCCNRTGPDDSVVWKKMRALGYDAASGAFILALEDFTYAHTGLYECLHSDGRQLVVTQRYWISASLFRDQVFQPPMQNLTIRYGDPAALECAVSFNFLPGRLTDRFLWRRGRYLLMAAGIPAVADQIASWWGYDGRVEVGISEQRQCHSTLKIDRVTWRDAGRYECWFRIDDRLDEWIMQEAHLHVI